MEVLQFLFGVFLISAAVTAAAMLGYIHESPERVAAQLAIANKLAKKRGGKQ